MSNITSRIITTATITATMIATMTTIIMMTTTLIMMTTTLIMIRTAITVTKAKQGRAVSQWSATILQLVGSLDGLIHFDKWTMRFAPST